MCKNKESPQGATTRVVTGVRAPEQRKSIRINGEGFGALHMNRESTPEYAATWTWRNAPKAKFLGTKRER
jgi:hypothetical protein